MTRESCWLIVMGSWLLLGGCHREPETLVVPDDWEDTSCNPADDCNTRFQKRSTIRQHSEQAGIFSPLAAGCPFTPEEVPALESLDSASIPEFRRSRNRASNMQRANERLQDIDLHEHLMGVQGQLFTCVDMAACYDGGEELSGGGDLDFDFELLPDGKVAAVSVAASPGLNHPSVIACARQTLFQYRFPQYDGGQMMIQYTMTIEEVDDA